MIRHILSIIGLIVMIIISLICYFFGKNPQYDYHWILAIAGFIILIFLVYSNMKKEEAQSK